MTGNLSAIGGVIELYLAGQSNLEAHIESSHQSKADVILYVTHYLSKLAGQDQTVSRLVNGVFQFRELSF